MFNPPKCLPNEKTVFAPFQLFFPAFSPHMFYVQLAVIVYSIIFCSLHKTWVPRQLFRPNPFASIMLTVVFSCILNWNSALVVEHRHTHTQHIYVCLCVRRNQINPNEAQVVIWYSNGVYIVVLRTHLQIYIFELPYRVDKTAKPNSIGKKEYRASSAGKSDLGKTVWFILAVDRPERNPFG